MTNKSLALPPALSFVPERARTDARSRLTQYQSWMESNSYSFTSPNLVNYRDYLLEHKQASTASNHLSTIRTRYKEILRSSEFRDYLYSVAQRKLANGSPADYAATVNEFVTRIENAIDPRAAPVDVLTKQDVADSQHMRLTPLEVARYLDVIASQPEWIDKEKKQRNLTPYLDTAIVSLMLCTGIRRGELRNLRISDLNERLDGKRALLIRQGKGNKQRMIPFGALEWGLQAVEEWLFHAGIEGQNEYVFRGLTTDRAGVRSGKIGLSTVNLHFSKYSIVLDNGVVAVPNPHDLRRTYARNWYLAYEFDGLNALQENLGHSNQMTTMIYVGVADVTKRAADKNIYEVD